MSEFTSQVIMTLTEYNELLEVKNYLQNKVKDLETQTHNLRQSENNCRLDLILALDFIQKNDLQFSYNAEGWLHDYRFKELINEVGIKNATYLKSKDIRVPVEETTQGETE
jgi:hypothetical protein